MAFRGLTSGVRHGPPRSGWNRLGAKVEKGDRLLTTAAFALGDALIGGPLFANAEDVAGLSRVDFRGTGEPLLEKPNKTVNFAALRSRSL
jgi:hypothetical protein